MNSYVSNLVKEAKNNSYLVSNLNTDIKNKLLKSFATALLRKKRFIIGQNRKDILEAENKKIKKSFIDRLKLNDKRINDMAQSLIQIAALDDPVGEVISGYKRPNGIFINKVRTPIGVILIIYEARPNVTSDCIGLCFKSSNIAILRGGSSAINSNRAIFRVFKEVVQKEKLGFMPFFFIDKTDYSIMDSLLKNHEFIDLVIPRGGESLIKKVTENSLIPVIKHYKGVCHIFIDKSADYKKALDICVNAKVQRPSVCNAVETILVHKDETGILPLLKKEFDKYKVKIKGCRKTKRILKGIDKATEDDWYTEYLDLIVSVKIVSNVSEAVSHINFYGSHHTDSIVTENINDATEFVNRVDSACCFVNISTRFSDGNQFGLGAEIGISTDKLHARGPMGIKELTTYKYVVYGDGQIRE